jgi:hypothetical protein
VDEVLVAELIELERRIAADEYKITLARAAGGNNPNKVTLEEDLKRRIAETNPLAADPVRRVRPPGRRVRRHH